MNFDIDKLLNIIYTELHRWLEVSVKSLPKIALAILVILVTFIVAGFFKKLLHRIFSRSTKNQAALQLVETTLYVALICVGFFIALGILQLDKTVTSLLAGAGVVGLALGFAFQEIASNFVSGVLIAFQEPYRIGDIVKVDSYVGQVSRIELRSTTLTTFDGLDVLVPNKAMYTQALVNYTYTSRRRLEITVGVSYAENLREVERIAIAAVEKIPGRIESEPIGLFFNEFADSSINFLLHVWVEYPAQNNFLRFQHAAIIAIKEAFDKNGITIPFPIRTLDFGIKGGQELATQLSVREDTDQKV